MNRHERRKEDSEKRKENKRLKGSGFSWRKSASGEWCWTYDEESNRVKIKSNKGVINESNR